MALYFLKVGFIPCFDVYINETFVQIFFSQVFRILEVQWKIML